jgi:cytochrome oxidase assembly protein ShyY1
MIFRTSFSLTLLLFVFALIFGRMGLWQLERKSEKEELFEQFNNAPFLPVGQAMIKGERFVHVEAVGYYDATRHILLDNRIFNGRPGVHVLTPFTLTDDTVLLVNRGWLPMPSDRLSLPLVPTDDSPGTISGRLNVLPTEGIRVGKADILATDHWPQLVTYLEPGAVGAALGVSLAPWIVQLDAVDDSGFEDRHWKPAVMGPAVHGAYAFQWFSLLAVTIIIWIALGIRRARLLTIQQS